MGSSSPRRRVAIVLALALLTLVVPFTAPIGIAQACGCGAFSPQRGGRATVPQETGLVRMAGDGWEDLYLALTVDSDVRSGALLFPVPDRHAAVSAGPRKLFSVLAALTASPVAPAAGDAAGGNGAAAPSVTVEKRQQIGPLDVVTLTANDAGALTTWLTTHGFAAKPALASVASTYVRQGWAFVAVRLRPSVSAERLDGQLDPLHLRFRTARAVYPMRLSHLASEPEQVRVFTLGRHRMSLETADPGMRTVFAGRLSGEQDPALEPLLTGGTDFLTRYDGTLTPATITDDFRFAATADTALWPAAGGSYEESGSAYGPAALVALMVISTALIAAIAAGLAVLARRRRRPTPC